MALLIIFAALSGYHWGGILEGDRVYQHDVLIAALCFTVLAVIVALAIEAAVTRTEYAAAAAQTEEERKAAEADLSKQHLRELDRIVSRLSQDNSDLKYQLMSNKLHHMGEDTMAAKPVGASHIPAWRARTS